MKLKQMEEELSPRENETPKGDGLLLYTVYIPAPGLVQRNFYIYIFVCVHTRTHASQAAKPITPTWQLLLWLCFYISPYPASSF